MSSRMVLRRLSLLGLAGTVVACASAPAATGTGPPAGARAFRSDALTVSQVEIGAQLTFDEGLLGLMPPSMSGDVAGEMLAPVAPQAISAAFAPSRYAGLTGTYLGFSPGFSVEVLAMTRFLRAGNILVPYTLAQNRWVPYCFTDRRQGVYIYPVLVEVDGVLVPMYHVRRILVVSVPVVYLVSAPVVFVSPVDIILVPPPIIFVPVVVQAIRILPVVQVVDRIRILEVIRPEIVLPAPIIQEVRARATVRQIVPEALVVRRLERLAREQERFDVQVHARIEGEERLRAESQARLDEAVRTREASELRVRDAEQRLRERAELREDVERRVRERIAAREAVRQDVERRAKERQDLIDRIRAEERAKLGRDAAERGRASRESAEREQEAKEATESQRAAREAAEREQVVREAAERDRIQRETVERDRADRERVQKEAADRERVQKEAADRERVQKEAADRERVLRERPARGRGGGGGPKGEKIDMPPPDGARPAVTDGESLPDTEAATGSAEQAAPADKAAPGDKDKPGRGRGRGRD